MDAVVIVTPTSTHASLIEACLRAGKAVWSEKPIALDLAETDRIVALWRETGVPVQLGFMRRFDPGYVRAKELIDSGQLGKVEQFRAYSRDTYPPPLEFIRHSGGSFLDMSVHKSTWRGSSSARSPSPGRRMRSRRSGWRSLPGAAGARADRSGSTR